MQSVTWRAFHQPSERVKLCCRRGGVDELTRRANYFRRLSRVPGKITRGVQRPEGANRVHSYLD